MSDTLMSPADALILVVDDEPLNRTIIEALLRKGGFRDVVGLADGASALAFLERRIPACILLDVMMPEIDGLEVCRRLRADPRFARIPVIVQTGMSSPEDRRAAFAAGASDVVAKPYDPAELEARVRVHLSNALLSAGLLAYRSHMEAELREARALSETVLPQPGALADIAARGVALSQYYRPCTIIGGDYWNSWVLADGTVALAVGDVSGHGVSAALRMFALHTLMTPPPPFSADPSAVAAHLDRRLHAYGHHRGQYVAGVYGVVDPVRGTFRFVPGGLRDGFIRRRDGTLDAVPLSGLPFGLVAETTRPARDIPLADGDTLILYSDALVECDGLDRPRGEEDLRAWMAPLLARAPSPDRLAPWLAECFLAEFGDGVSDDLLIVTATLGPA
ncbi:MAG TPA: fused response regulator/phosphatase [Azospirillum sp.]